MPGTSRNTEAVAAPIRQARIDLAALRHNLERVRKLAPDRRIMAVIKGNAYGHGAVHAAQTLTRALATADAFAVATLEEGAALRQAGIVQPIVVLGGPLSPAQVEIADRHQFDLVLYHHGQLPWVANFGQGVWLKLDTGMHRLGFPPQDVATLYDWSRQAGAPHLRGWMTHLACADEPADGPGGAMTRSQLARFNEALADIPGDRSIANSAGVCAWPDSHADWLRPGIMLYGSSPLNDSAAAELGLKPVMHLHSQLMAVRELKAGEAVGYGATWRCPEEMPMGVVAIGYADGYPRHAPSGTPVAVNGTRCSLIGRVSMDMITVDLRPVPDAQPGDPVELWGAQVPVDEVAQHCGTISYELLSKITSRVQFSYD